MLLPVGILCIIASIEAAARNIEGFHLTLHDGLSAGSFICRCCNTAVKPASGGRCSPAVKSVAAGMAVFIRITETVLLSGFALEWFSTHASRLLRSSLNALRGLSAVAEVAVIDTFKVHIHDYRSVAFVLYCI